jgi:hypothetical protein
MKYGSPLALGIAATVNLCSRVGEQVWDHPPAGHGGESARPSPGAQSVWRALRCVESNLATRARREDAAGSAGKFWAQAFRDG